MSSAAASNDKEIKEETELTVYLNVTKKTEDIKGISKPQKLGSFSIEKTKDGERIFHPDDRQMMILKYPSDMNNVHLDLKPGYIPLSQGGPVYEFVPENSHPLYEWMLLNHDNFKLPSNADPSQPETPFNTDFVGGRGTFSRIMQMPYQKGEDILICATLFKGTIYLVRFATEEKLEKIKRTSMNLDDRSNFFSYSGHKFEDLVTVPAYPEKILKPVDGVFHESNSVVRTRFNNMSIVMACESDCIKPGLDFRNWRIGDFVELKTTTTVSRESQVSTIHKYKTFKWWTQCYLDGTTTILVGHRDDDHVIRRVELCNVKELDKISPDWDRKVCLNFLNEFLNNLKTVVTEDDHRCVYKFHYKPTAAWEQKQNVVTCTKTYSDKFRVLPDWFVEKVDCSNERMEQVS